MAEIYQNSPFREPITFHKQDNWHRYGTLPDFPGWRIRVFCPVPGTLVRKEQEDMLDERVLLWKEFSGYTGIHIPDFRIVEGEGVGNSYNGVKIPFSFYRMTRHIEGETFEDLDVPLEKQQAAAEKMDAMFSGLIRYCRDKQTNGGRYISDHKLEQYMYGKMQGDEQDKCYFVDLDWEAGYWDPKNPEHVDSRSVYGFLVPSIINMMGTMEKKTGNRKFQAARIEIAKILEGISPTGGLYSRITKILDNLDSQ